MVYLKNSYLKRFKCISSIVRQINLKRPKLCSSLSYLKLHNDFTSTSSTHDAFHYNTSKQARICRAHLSDTP